MSLSPINDKKSVSPRVTRNSIHEEKRQTMGSAPSNEDELALSEKINLTDESESGAEDSPSEKATLRLVHENS